MQHHKPGERLIWACTPAYICTGALVVLVSACMIHNAARYELPAGDLGDPWMAQAAHVAVLTMLAGQDCPATDECNKAGSRHELRLRSCFNIAASCVQAGDNSVTPRMAGSNDAHASGGLSSTSVQRAPDTKGFIVKLQIEPSACRHALCPTTCA